MEQTGLPGGMAARAGRSALNRLKAGLGHATHLWQQSPRFVRRPIELAIRTLRLYGKDDGSIYAAAIAYYALFSLVPLALITVSVFGLFVNPDRMVDWVFEQFPLEETEAVRSDVRNLLDLSKTLGGAGLGVGIVTLLWSASGLFGAVRRGLNATRQGRPSRPFWRSKLLDFMLVLGAGGLVATSVLLTTLTRVAIERVGDLGFVEIDSSFALRFWLYVLSAALSVVMFTLLYRFVPASRPSWRAALAGGVVAALLFELLKNLGAVLLESAALSRDASVYSSVSVVFGFLFWVFLNASVLLIGSEFIRALTEPAPGAVERSQLPLP